MKTKGTQIHLLSDVLVAIASLNLKHHACFVHFFAAVGHIQRESA